MLCTSFGHIASGYVNSFFIIELLYKNGKEILVKSKMSQQKWKLKWKWSADGISILNKQKREEVKGSS
jgi:hypothetical protein